jgi:hypothetical protein
MKDGDGFNYEMPHRIALEVRVSYKSMYVNGNASYKLVIVKIKKRSKFLDNMVVYYHKSLESLKLSWCLTTVHKSSLHQDNVFY